MSSRQEIAQNFDAKLPKKYEIARDFDAKLPKIYENAQNFARNFETLHQPGGPVPPRPPHLLRLYRLPIPIPRFASVNTNTHFYFEGFSKSFGSLAEPLWPIGFTIQL